MGLEIADQGKVAESRVFLLSPANLGGARAKPLLDGRAWERGRSVAEIYTYISSLYFRGKVAYAERFAKAPPNGPSALVMVPGMGLVPLEAEMDVALLRAAAEVPVDAEEPRFTGPLVREAEALISRCVDTCRFVLLGSVASGKYVEPLLPVFASRLVFPSEFVGRGDMSRGGLMLRAAEAGTELEYISVAGAILRGKRPPKLPKKPRSG
ncbi:MAG: hypothetical protein JNK87_02890 [Bryobacterales bacterium]|nr:hypothetical protein [Bryobacterales bacterium]